MALSLLLPTGLAAGDPGAEKTRVDSEIGRLRGQAEEAERRAGVLTDELSTVAGRVRELENGVAAQQARLDVLEGQLAGARARLGALDRTIADQSRRLGRLRGEYARRRLELRVRELYMTDGPDVLSFVLGTSSFTDLLDNLELLGRIGRQDERIAARVKASRDGVADARRHEGRACRSGAGRGVRGGGDRGAARRRHAARRKPGRARRGPQKKSATLASITEDRESVLAEIDALAQQSAELAARIRQAQQESSIPAVVSPTGSGILGWPVSGPVTSGFGWRWGRMHEGIDIMVGEGTPVRAAAAGR